MKNRSNESDRVRDFNYINVTVVGSVSRTTYVQCIRHLLLFLNLLCKEMELALIPYKETPDHWLHVHKAATTASLAAGAITYGITSVSGKAATSVVSNTVRIGGSVVSYAGWYLAGDLVGIGLQTGTTIAATSIDTAGQYATMIGSMAFSTAVAIGVGTTVMLGNTVYTMYQNSRISQPIHEIKLVEQEEEEFVVYLLEDKDSKDNMSAAMTAVD